MSLPYYLDPPDPHLLMSDNYLVVDFETTSKEKGSALNSENRMLMASWYYNGEYHTHIGDEFNQELLQLHIDRCALLVAHNLKFELHWLYRMGIEYGVKLGYDTMLGDYVIAGNRQMPFNLDAVADRWKVRGKESVVAKLMKAEMPVEEIPTPWVAEYCTQDVRATRDIFLKQRASLNKCGMIPVMFTRCILTPVLAALEEKGMQLDCGMVSFEHAKQERRLQEIEIELWDLVERDVNWNSNHQLAELLYGDEFKFKELKRYGKFDRNAPNKQFPDGMPKTDLGTIGQLKATNKRQRKLQALLIEKSKVSASLSKNLDYFKGLCDQRGGLLYGDLMQHRTATHRLSSGGRKVALETEDGKIEEKGAQLQNIPRTYKKLFKGRDGKLVVESDYAQLEFRIAGILGKDQNIRDDVLAGIDVHTNAMTVLNDAGLDCDRTGAKQHSFRPLFSVVMDKKKPTPEDEYSKWFKTRYSGIANEQMKWAQIALRDKKIRAASGLVFHYPQCKVSSTGYINEINKIFNHQIQSLAGAEVTPVALIYLYWLTKDIDGIDLILTVHDSIIAEVDRQTVTKYCELVTVSMLDRVYDYLENIYGIEIYCPLGIGMKAGTHWSRNDLTLEERCDIVQALNDNGYTRAFDDDGEIKIDFYEKESVND